MALLSGLSGLFGGPKRAKAQDSAALRQQKKEELLELIEPLKRGLAATAEDQEAVEEVVQQLERLNPTPKPLESPYLNGQWRLVYTTSDSILGRSKPAFLWPSGPIYQLLDGPNLRAANKETAPLFNQVYAELQPMSVNKVAVQFKTFKIFGLIPISAPASAKGELAMTYLDDEMRISRGDKGNLFVLLMDDPDARP
uniref:Plastid lipid-associated protein/fibrillin conserved domain-containing protein n=1 Tax=Tetradesmus obliquus TaxID=3088 RepID=A0A383VK47_TETOB|eukprot:jgi/Sobl393_1/10889/SZX65290.1